MGWNAAILLLASLLPGGCASISAHSNAAPGVDFAKYRTFAQAPAPTEAPRGMPGYSAITAERIQTAIARELTAKGLRRTDADSDLLVAFTVSGEPQTEVWGTGGWGWYGPPGSVTTTHYVKGTLVINVYDARQEKLVWHGWGTKDVFEPKGDEQSIREAVQAVLARYPE